MSGSITLADVAARTPTLTIACARCSRAGRYHLIAQHGPAFGVPDLLELLSADCPKRTSANFYDRCGCHCSDLPGLFIGRSG